MTTDGQHKQLVDALNEIARQLSIIAERLEPQKPVTPDPNSSHVKFPKPQKP